MPDSLAPRKPPADGRVALTFREWDDYYANAPDGLSEWHYRPLTPEGAAHAERTRERTMPTPSLN